VSNDSLGGSLVRVPRFLASARSCVSVRIAANFVAALQGKKQKQFANEYQENDFEQKKEHNA
jgi:hypothetical protein